MSARDRVADVIGQSLPVMNTEFDPLGPVVHTIRVASGRTMRYIDEGDRTWPTLLFFGGAGTSVRAFGLLEFARSFREELGVRVVSVERNGLGGTPFDPGQGMTEHAEDVWDVVDHLGVPRPSVMMISGGGPYAAHVMAARPGAVRSVHVACAYAEALPGFVRPFDVDDVADDPVSWWAYPPDSTVAKVPGFIDSTVDEATRARFTQGRHRDPEGLRHAFHLYETVALPALDAITAQAFLYWGSEDKLVTNAHLERWNQALPQAVVRRYEVEGHDVQYRHWDQVLCDVVHLGQRIVLSDDTRTVLAPADQATDLIDSGWTLGLRAWR